MRLREECMPARPTADRSACSFSRFADKCMLLGRLGNALLRGPCERRLRGPCGPCGPPPSMPPYATWCRLNETTATGAETSPRAA